MRSMDVGQRIPAHRILSAKEVIHEDTEAVEVGLRRGKRASKQLRCRVQRCSRGARRSDTAAELTGPEVHQDNASALFAYDILRLDVTVDQTRLVHGLQGSAQVCRDRYDIAGSQRP